MLEFGCLSPAFHVTLRLSGQPFFTRTSVEGRYFSLKVLAIRDCCAAHY